MIQIDKPSHRRRCDSEAPLPMLGERKSGENHPDDESDSHKKKGGIAGNVSIKGQVQTDPKSDASQQGR